MTKKIKITWLHGGTLHVGELDPPAKGDKSFVVDYIHRSGGLFVDGTRFVPWHAICEIDFGE